MTSRRHVEVRDAFIGVHHVEFRPVADASAYLDRPPRSPPAAPLAKLPTLVIEGADAVVWIGPGLLQDIGVLCRTHPCR